MMKHFIHLIIVFLIGVGVGAYWGRNTVQDQAIQVATQAYEQGLNAVVASGSAEISAQGTAIVDDLKTQGSEYIKEQLKNQIDSIFQ